MQRVPRNSSTVFSSTTLNCLRSVARLALTRSNTVDAAFGWAQKRARAKPGVNWNIAMRPGKRALLDKSTEQDKIVDEIEYLKTGIRAQVEHPFRVNKRHARKCT
jgi:hypothetical protein